ncbi:MAG TPA: site-specific integrase [Acidimicrobiales bacterium]|nr:site-specific integrase [Acidimicrobiales bacterium]
MAKVRNEARRSGVEARRRAKAEASIAAGARSSTAVERVAFVKQRLREEGFAERSILAYAAEQRRAEWWCEERGKTLLTVPGDLLLDYVEIRPSTQPTRKLIRNALGHYWRILERADPPLWAIRQFRKPRMVCRALDDEDAQALSEHARRRGGIEAFAVLLGLYQALRRFEIARVRWEDFTDDGWFQVIGKGDKPAKLPVHPLVAEALSKLDRSSSPWVFPGRFRNSRRSHVCEATIWQWVSDIAVEAGIGHVAPHVLRHTALATANDSTGDLRAVQDLARHSDIGTTAGYTRTTTRRLIAATVAINYGEPPPDRGEAPPARPDLQIVREA